MSVALHTRSFHDFSLLGIDAKIRLESRPFCAASLEEWRHWMSVDEQAEVSTYRYVRDQELFVARRGILRELLSQSLDINPGCVRFERTELHQLQLTDSTTRDRQNISFSLSKSRDWVGAAVAYDRLIGIDLEQIHPLPELTQLAQNHLHEDEFATWIQLPDEDRLTNYFYRWTAKEAALKAMGLGLSVSTRQVFVLDSKDSQPSKIYWTSKSSSVPQEIGQLWRIQLPKQHVGSIAVLNPDIEPIVNLT